MSQLATNLSMVCRARALLLIALALPFMTGADGRSSAPAAALIDRLPPAWRADDDETLRLSALKGQRIFVTMAYTACHVVCPTTIARLAQLQRDLDARRISAEFVIVSYDPVNDDPAAWRRYRRSHRLLRDNWHFLSGTPADTERLAQLLGFEFWRDGDHVMHDYRIVALGRDGAVRGVLTSARRDVQDLL